MSILKQRIQNLEDQLQNLTDSLFQLTNKFEKISMHAPEQMHHKPSDRLSRKKSRLCLNKNRQSNPGNQFSVYRFDTSDTDNSFVSKNSNPRRHDDTATMKDFLQFWGSDSDNASELSGEIHPVVKLEESDQFSTKSLENEIESIAFEPAPMKSPEDLSYIINRLEPALQQRFVDKIAEIVGGRFASYLEESSQKSIVPVVPLPKIDLPTIENATKATTAGGLTFPLYQNLCQIPYSSQSIERFESASGSMVK